MKTGTLHPRITVETIRKDTAARQRVDWSMAGRRALPWGVGLSAFAALAILATWAATHGAHDMTGALSWMAGIGFLAMAVDSGGRRARLLFLSGVMLMALGWLSSRIAGEFGLLAALLVAAWLTCGISLRVARGEIPSE